MKFTTEHEQEEDGRWLAAVPELPGVLAYGATAEEAMAKAEVLALRIIAERLGVSLKGSRRNPTWSNRLFTVTPTSRVACRYSTAPEFP